MAKHSLSIRHVLYQIVTNALRTRQGRDRKGAICGNSEQLESKVTTNQITKQSYSNVISNTLFFIQLVIETGKWLNVNLPRTIRTRTTKRIAARTQVAMEIAPVAIKTEITMEVVVKERAITRRKKEADIIQGRNHMINRTADQTSRDTKAGTPKGMEDAILALIIIKANVTRNNKLPSWGQI